jgi:hypothetical protein
MEPPACDPGDFCMAQRAESTLFIPEKAKSTGTPKRFQHVSPFPFFEVGFIVRFRQHRRRIRLCSYQVFERR